jgi:Protein of unknown function (DUF3304)
MTDPMKRNLMKAVGLAFGLSVVSGCAGAQPKNRSVSTVKFNYTERYIGDVTVDGVWTGGVDAFGGGGSRVEGLMAPADLSRSAVVQVKWIVSGRLDFSTNRYIELPLEKKQAAVEVAMPYPANPSYLVVHFYPDGHVEAELEADRPKRRIAQPAGYPR